MMTTLPLISMRMSSSGDAGQVDDDLDGLGGFLRVERGREDAGQQAPVQRPRAVEVVEEPPHLVGEVADLGKRQHRVDLAHACP